MSRHPLHFSPRRRHSAIAQWSIAFASIGFVALAVINIWRA
jgi:hypothetical protein